MGVGGCVAGVAVAAVVSMAVGCSVGSAGDSSMDVACPWCSADVAAAVAVSVAAGCGVAAWFSLVLSSLMVVC